MTRHVPLTPVTASSLDVESQSIQRLHIPEASVFAACEALPSSNSPKQDDDASIPWAQIMTLFFLRGSRPLIYGMVFSFVNEQVVSLGIANEKNAGFYSGIIEASMAIAIIIGLPIAGFAGSYGRKPVVLVGTLLTCFVSGFYGFQSNFFGLVAVRTATGLFGASGIALMPMVEEISNDTNGPRCYAIMYSIFLHAECCVYVF